MLHGPLRSAYLSPLYAVNLFNLGKREVKTKTSGNCFRFRINHEKYISVCIFPFKYPLQNLGAEYITELFMCCLYCCKIDKQLKMILCTSSQRLNINYARQCFCDCWINEKSISRMDVRAAISVEATYTSVFIKMLKVLWPHLLSKQ